MTRDEAINTLAHFKVYISGGGVVDKKANEAIDFAIATLIKIADRPQGEWIYCEDEYGIDGYRCSNCGKHIPWDYQHKFINFIDDYHTCPFCDARMKGADDDIRSNR